MTCEGRKKTACVTLLFLSTTSCFVTHRNFRPLPHHRYHSKIQQHGHSKQNWKTALSNSHHHQRRPTVTYNKQSVTQIRLHTSDESDEDTYSVSIQKSIFYVLIAAVFGAGLCVIAGPATGQEFFAGYIVEKSLSVDNLFVFLLLFDYFKVPSQYQGRILIWGIYGSVVMRAIMISLGAVALENFHEILLVFAAILIYSAFQVLYDVEDDDEEDLRNNPVIKIAQNLFQTTDSYEGGNFFTLEDGVNKATPLFICMIAVELSDVVFAVDSIPAVFGVTEVSVFPITCFFVCTSVNFLTESTVLITSCRIL